MRKKSLPFVGLLVVFSLPLAAQEPVVGVDDPESLFDGRNPYIEAIRTNITHLVRIISTGNWALLRRDPPYFVGIISAIHDVEHYVKEQLSALTGRAVEENDLLMPV